MRMGEGELPAGEEVLWVGETVRKPGLDAVDVLLAPFFAGGVAILVVFGVISWVSKSPVAVVGVVMALVGPSVVARAWWRRRSTDRRYVLTNLRVIAEERGAVRTAALRNLRPPVVRTRDDSGVGTIGFGKPPLALVEVIRELGGRGVPSEPPIVLVEVGDVQTVRELIERAQNPGSA